MKNKLYKLRKLFWLFLTDLVLRINNYKLFALIIYFNTRNLKKINCTGDKFKRILVFSKSGGTEDLVYSLNNKKNNIKAFILPRSFLKKVHLFYFKKKKEDYYTKINNNDEINKKRLYVNFLTLSFEYLDKFFKIDGFISFNLFYYSEKDFEEVCINLKKKFIILHKESTLTPKEEKFYTKLYKKYNSRSLSYKISVYSNSQKKILLRSKIATKNQIVVNGCPRSDASFKLRKINSKKRIIVFYLIETQRGFLKIPKMSKIWKNLYKQTLDHLHDYMQNNSNIKLILKGKTGVHKKETLSKYINNNCSFIEGGPGEKFLKDAKVVIAFNSTIVFEAIASQRNLIIPNFNNENKICKNQIHKIKNKNYFVNSKKEFFIKLDNYLNNPNKKQIMLNDDKDTLDYYLGNIDGKSSYRVMKFLHNSLN